VKVFQNRVSASLSLHYCHLSNIPWRMKMYLGGSEDIDSILQVAVRYLRSLPIYFAQCQVETILSYHIFSLSSFSRSLCVFVCLFLQSGSCHQLSSHSISAEICRCAHTRSTSTIYPSSFSPLTIRWPIGGPSGRVFRALDLHANDAVRYVGDM
jgi:hypothetical protein